MKRFLITALVFFLGLNAALAAESRPVQSARLLNAVIHSNNDAASVRTGLLLKLAPGWKTYWRTPGIAGEGLALDIARARNVKSVDIGWPAPARFTVQGIETAGYKGDIVFPLTVTPENKNAPVELNITARFIVCDTVCIPVEKNLSAHFTVPARNDPDDEKLLRQKLDELPVQKDNSEKIISRAAFQNNAILIEGQGEELLRDIFIETGDRLDISRPVINQDSHHFTARFPVQHFSNDLSFLSKPWIITLVTNSGVSEYKVQPDRQTNSSGSYNLSLMLGFALLGGLILNIMPCVLPVLSLKLLSILTHGGETRRKIRLSFLMTSAGILVSFWVMALAIFLLKETGRQIGWGIQFQQPAFLIMMIVILIVFAVSLWGVFHLHLPRFIADKLENNHSGTRMGHFLTGAFATLLATPCTAPFLGTATGFALSETPPVIFAVFTAMASGFALPYLVVAAFPKLVILLPRPGAWIVHVRKIMALLLLGTALWLGLVLKQIWMPIPDQKTISSWHEFDENFISESVRSGFVVFVDITASWCLTCHANDIFVLDRAQTRDFFRANHIVLVRADWTSRDDKIAAYLQTFGRAGIPFNIVFGPNAKDGIILNEILSFDEIGEAIEKAR